jgi:hypothetical protein
MSKNKFSSLFDQEPTALDFESLNITDGLSSMPTEQHQPLILPSEESTIVIEQVHDHIKKLDHTQAISSEMEEMYQDKIQQTWSLLDRWKDRTMYDKVQKVKGEMFELTAKQRLTLYDLLLQSRVQQTKEKYDSALKCIKAHYRRHVSTFVMHQMESLAEEIKGYQFRFLEMQKSKYQYAETVKHIPSLHDRYMKSLFMQEERYLMFLDKLMMKFDGVVSEELSIYNQR